MKPYSIITLIALLLCFLQPLQAQTKNLSFEDIYQFQYAKSTKLSENGRILAFNATPYRGTKVGHVYDLNSNKLIAQVDNADQVTINKNAFWVSFTQTQDLLTLESSNKKERKKLPQDLVLVNTKNAQSHLFKNVKDHKISADGKWLAYREANQSHDKQQESNSKKEQTEPERTFTFDKKDKPLTLKVIDLNTFKVTEFKNVLHYALANQHNALAFNQIYQDGIKNQISVIDLTAAQQTVTLFKEQGITVAAMAWHPTHNQLALSVGNYSNQDQRRRNHTLYLWQQKNQQLAQIPLHNQTWQIGKTANLMWSEQGERLYFENRPALSEKYSKKKYKTQSDLTDTDVIRDQTGVKIWHPQDNQIKPREIQQWDKNNKLKHYQAVYHLAKQKVVQLTSPKYSVLDLNTEKNHLVIGANQDYLKEVMFNGFYSDYYAKDIHNEKQHFIIKKSRFKPTLSPDGQHAAYFKDDQIYLKHLTSQKQYSLTQNLNAIFTDDKHDYPSETPGFGFAGWSQDSQSLFAYSKYDIWRFDIQTQKAQQLTHGSKNNIQYRVKVLDTQKLAFADDETLLLSTHNLNTKQTGVVQLSLANLQLKTLLSGDKKYTLTLKAKHAERIIYTEQSYHQFPDYWQTNNQFKTIEKVTELNPQISQFAWGQTPELVQYKGYNGEDLQGVLIKPANYKTGDKVPVVIYFYRYMSQRRFDFPKMELNHRPNFPMFTSNGYAIFLPDIRFEIGHPGKSSTQTMINAAQKLIDIGVADKHNIGLQGHSWAGYQSAFMVTQTDMFKAVVSGAPVSNMTSAYSGIRLKSGLARQFQYETGQSRIGQSLFDAPDLYIANSPVFFADKVNTPIMLMFGDKDGAVPWQEGIQYYLALHRAGKDVIFLQYEDEPHHLKQFPNQVDFSIRMMEYFDHHLKGKPAPQWMQQGKAHIKE